MEGFIVDLSPKNYHDMLTKLAPLFAIGQIQGTEDVYNGIDRVPEALVGL